MRKKRFVQMIMLFFLISLTSFTIYQVYTTRTQLIALKQDLQDIEDGKITYAQATHIPENNPFTTVESVHVEGAYLWLAPFGIIDVILIILYFVIFHT